MSPIRAHDKAKPLQDWRDELYQRRAQQAFPVLVRLALAARRVTYENFAGELRMPNPRNLDYVLGCVGNTLNSLDSKIPLLQGLVINKSTKMPGIGFDGFIKKAGHHPQTPEKRSAAVERLRESIYAYDGKWLDVLSELERQKLISNGWGKVVFDLPGAQTRQRFGTGGESKIHRQFKEWIADHPAEFGMPEKGNIEYRFVSGDAIDVLFQSSKKIVGVEAKSRISNNDDIKRGLFQVVKYRALIAAHQTSGDLPELPAKVFLALATKLPRELDSLKNLLGVGVKVVCKIKSG